MDNIENDRIEKLCSLIAVEQDQQKLLSLVEELNQILSAENEPSRNKKPDDQRPTNFG